MNGYEIRKILVSVSKVVLIMYVFLIDKSL